MYQVLARKWRPQTFEQLVGQDRVTQTLSNAIQSDRLAHAYIFAGLRGTGKTTAARILAKCLNCEQGPTVTPCNACDACREIAEGRAMDVLEVDAASRTGVDNVRELQEVISYSPARDRYRVLIIDEAHMLSKAAFNALLKTLEEPPPHVLFVLATTELHKVLPTILSRCQVFEFRRVGVGQLVEHLRKICDAEKIEVSASALERIARSGEGSVRDVLSVLEGVIAFGGQQVADDDVLRMLGGVRSEVLNGFVGALAARDAGRMLATLDRLVDEGHDLLHFWGELVAALRDLLLLDAVPDAFALLGRGQSDAEALRQAAAGLSREDLSRAFHVLAELEPALKGSAQPRFQFEAALIRLASLGAVRPIEEVLAALDGVPLETPPKKKKHSPRLTEPEPAPVPVRAPTRAPAPAGLRDRLVADVMADKAMVGAILEQAFSIEVVGATVELGFREGMAALVKRLEAEESRQLVERHATRLLGRPVTVRIQGPGPEGSPRTAAAAPAERPAATAAPAGSPPGSPSGSPPEAPPRASHPPSPAGRRRSSIAATLPPEAGDPQLLELATSEPGVQKLLREFGAQVLEVRPLGGAEEPRTPGTAKTPETEAKE